MNNLYNSEPNPLDVSAPLSECWGETTIVEEKLKFSWVINDYLRVSDDAKVLVKSPPFDGLPNSNHKWQIRVRPKRGENTGLEFLSVHLYLLEFNPINSYESEDDVEMSDQELRGCFHLSLIDADGNQFKQCGGRFIEKVSFKNNSGWGYDNLVPVQAIRQNHRVFLPNGNLHVKAQVWLMANPVHHVHFGRMPDNYPGTESAIRKSNSDRIVAEIGQMFQSEEKGPVTDVTVRVGNQAYSAHKVVLGARSSVFKAMFTTADVMENLENVVQIPDFDEQVVFAMLTFMYTGALEDTVLSARAPDLYRIGDKYDLPDLKQKCRPVVVQNLDVDNAMEVLWLAATYNDDFVKKPALGFVKLHKSNVMKSESFMKYRMEHAKTFMDLFMSLL